MVEIDLAFSHSYGVKELRELPGAGDIAVPVVYFPRPKSRPEHDGLWLEIVGASGRSWVGVFAFGYSSPPALSRVVSSPDPDRVCVISRGLAYIVKADEPENWEQIPIAPVLDLRLIQEEQLIIFSDFTRLAAYRNGGLAWRSPQVCWDELKILHITGDTIEGSGYDPVNLGQSRFVVDMRTGRSLLPPPTSIDGTPVW